MLQIDPSAVPPRDFYQYLIGAVAPRPIAFVSTLDETGNPNLAPYSFFNAFSGNPPMIAFSAARRSGPVAEKDTLNNIIANSELVVNSVSYNIVRQMALTSVEFPPGTDEFEKAGFTKLPSLKVAPFRVAESDFQMECRVSQIIPLLEGDQGASMIICRVLMLHINPAVLNESGRIDPHKADLMGRMGRQHYVRASGTAVVDIAQDTKAEVIGFGGLPESVRESPILTGNELAQIAALPALPSRVEAQNVVGDDAYLQKIVMSGDVSQLHEAIAALLAAGEMVKASAVVALQGV